MSRVQWALDGDELARLEGGGRPSRVGWRVGWRWWDKRSKVEKKELEGGESKVRGEERVGYRGEEAGIYRGEGGFRRVSYSARGV